MLLDNPNSNPQTLTLALTLALTLYNQAAGWGVECCSMLLLLLHIYHIRLQPVSHTVASSITYDCSLHHIRLRLQLPSYFHHIRLQAAGWGVECCSMLLLLLASLYPALVATARVYAAAYSLSLLGIGLPLLKLVYEVYIRRQYIRSI